MVGRWWLQGGEIVISQDTHDSVFWDRDITAMRRGSTVSGGARKSAVELMLEGIEATCLGPRKMKGIKEAVVCWRVRDRNRPARCLLAVFRH